MIASADITGLVLAGGQGSRMGGLDKGWQDFQGEPLAQRALRRLRPQTAQLMLSANRHLTRYATLGVPVWPDDRRLGEQLGPLAGFMAGLAHCTTPYLLTVPCDTPGFPADLAARLADGLMRSGARLALAATKDAHGKCQRQPVFCLMSVSVGNSLASFIAQGGRKIGAWAEAQAAVTVDFDLPHDDPQAFVNVNTLEELADLSELLIRPC